MNLNNNTHFLKKRVIIQKKAKKTLHILKDMIKYLVAKQLKDCDAKL